MNATIPSTSNPPPRPLTPTPTADITVSDYEDVTEDGTYLTISADVTEDEMSADESGVGGIGSPVMGRQVSSTSDVNSSSALGVVAAKKKKKKKRIRIRKNAKKLLKKMKSKSNATANSGDTANSPTALNGGTTANHHDHNMYNGLRNGYKVPNGGALSPREQEELHELFGMNDRGWCYAQRFSKEDTEWRPQNNIITKCNYRRRTWVRCAILDVVPDRDYEKERILKRRNSRKRVKVTDFKEDETASNGTASTTSTGSRGSGTSGSGASKGDTAESLKASITRTKSKANDLIAMIDGVLAGQGPGGVLEHSGSGYELPPDALTNITSPIRCIYTLSLSDWLTDLRSFGLSIFRILGFSLNTRLASRLYDFSGSYKLLMVALLLNPLPLLNSNQALSLSPNLRFLCSLEIVQH